MKNTFRTIFQGIPALNTKPIYSAGSKSLTEMINDGLKFNLQHLNFNIRQLFYNTSNNSIFKKYNILLESIIYSSKLIEQILEMPCKTFCPKQLSAKNLLNATNSQFQNDYKIINNIPVYILKYDFKSDIKYLINILKSFNINFDDNINTIKNMFKQFQESQGIILPNTNCIFLALNLPIFNIDTICHELYHCLQIICNIPLNIEPLLSNQLIDIPELNLTANQIQYYLSPKELQTYIQIDFINQCKDVYNKYYKNITDFKSFLINILNNIKQNPYNVYTCSFAKYLRYKPNIINKDLVPITIIAICLILNNKKYLEFILNIILTEIKN